MKLSIVIVNYNVKHYLAQCLRSVQTATSGMETEIIVVDNASIDGSREYITQRFHSVHWIQNEVNAGFSKANNQGIKVSSGEYILILNPDTLLCAEVLKECVKFMDTHEDAGSVGVRLLRPDGSFAYESRRKAPKAIPLFYKVTGLTSLFPRSLLFGSYYLSQISPLITQPVEILTGAFNLFRKTAGAEIGFWDERFYMFGADIDFSYSLLQKDWKNYYLPIPVLHYKGESVNRETFRYNYLFYRSILIFFRKHYVHYNWLSIPIRLGIYLKASSTWLYQQKRRVGRVIGLEKKRKKKAIFFFIGKTGMLEDCRKLCEKRHLNGRFFNVDEKPALLENGHEELRRIRDPKNENMTIVYIVYDMDTFSVSTVLDIFSRHPDPHIRIGTYSKTNPVLITDRYIYSQEA